MNKKDETIKCLAKGGNGLAETSTGTAYARYMSNGVRDNGSLIRMS